MLIKGHISPNIKPVWLAHSPRCGFNSVQPSEEKRHYWSAGWWLYSLSNVEFNDHSLIMIVWWVIEIKHVSDITIGF